MKPPRGPTEGPGSTRRRASPGAGLALAALALALAGPARGDDGRVERRPPSPRQSVFGNVLAHALDLRLLEVQGVVHRSRIGTDPIEGRGPCVRLEGLEVTRLEFEHPGDALYYLVQVARPERVPLVADARGRQLVLLSGEHLLDAARAARILRAAWADEVLAAAPRAVEALRVASPPEDEAAAAAIDFDSALLLGRGDSPAWDRALGKLRAARRYAREPTAGGPRVRFVSINRYEFEAADASSASILAMTRDGALEAVGRTAARCRVLVAYGRDLLNALGDDGPTRVAMLGLCDEVLGDAATPPPDQAPGALGGE